MTKRSRVRRWICLIAAATLATVIGSVVLGRSGAVPANADVSYSQNVQAVGETKLVRRWTKYGPLFTVAYCAPRAGTCAIAKKYWRVSRGTATVRVTTFKVTERIRGYDYFLLDVDVTTSSRSGLGDGGTGAFRLHSTGPRLYDRNDSRSIDARSSTCTQAAVTMSTPWPIVTASSTIGHATLCAKAADLTRSYAGSDALYHGHQLAKVRHLTMQRWVKVLAGKRPGFTVTVALPNDTCTGTDGDAHCARFDHRVTTRTITIGSSG